MMKHKPMCMVVTLLVVIGAVNWGLVGLGGFLKTDLNVVNLLLGSIAGGMVAWGVYILVGLAGLAQGYMTLTCKDCMCQSMDKK